MDEVFDPEEAVDISTNYYKTKDIYNNCKYAPFTNKIYETWFSISASEYKEFKGLRKESLRANMEDIEVILADLGEITRYFMRKK